MIRHKTSNYKRTQNTHTMNKDFKNIYFIGIGGIGMSALARFFAFKGYKIAGYDSTTTDLTKSLEKGGIKIHYQDDISLIDESFKNPKATLVVYTPAVPDSHTELIFFRNKGFEVIKRAKLLHNVTENKKTLAIAGSHGKTTISAMISHIFNKANKLQAGFVGGILKNYNSNFIKGQKPDGWIITEADEFDKSFLQLDPFLSVITAIEPDHLDIYSGIEDLKNTFEEFVSQTERVAIVNEKVKLKSYDKPYIFTYGFSSNADFCAQNIRTIDDYQIFDIKYFDGTIKDIKISLPGKMNIENSLAAFATSYLLSVGTGDIIEALSDFKGVERRFDTLYKSKQRIYINDYAHHPSEINKLYEAVKQFYPNKKITAVFQPHLYTRTRDFADGFADALSKFDEAIVTDIYPARERPIEGVSSQMIVEKMNSKSGKYCKYDEIYELIENEKPELLLTIGAGNIDNLTKKISEILSKIDQK